MHVRESSRTMNFNYFSWFRGTESSGSDSKCDGPGGTVKVVKVEIDRLSSLPLALLANISAYIGCATGEILILAELSKSLNAALKNPSFWQILVIRMFFDRFSN